MTAETQDISWGYLDELVDTDPIKLRDIAFKLASELTDLKDRLTALAAVEEFIGESCGNASHNLRDLLSGAGEDPRDSARHYGIGW